MRMPKKFYPPPRHCQKISWFCSFCLLFRDPAPPPTADVTYGSPLTVFCDILVNVEGCDDVSGDGEGGLLVGREVVHDAGGAAVEGGSSWKSAMFSSLSPHYIQFGTISDGTISGMHCIRVTLLGWQLVIVTLDPIPEGVTVTADHCMAMPLTCTTYNSHLSYLTSPHVLFYRHLLASKIGSMSIHQNPANGKNWTKPSQQIVNFAMSNCDTFGSNTVTVSGEACTASWQRHWDLNSGAPFFVLSEPHKSCDVTCNNCPNINCTPLHVTNYAVWWWIGSHHGCRWCWWSV